MMTVDIHCKVFVPEGKIARASIIQSVKDTLIPVIYDKLRMVKEVVCQNEGGRIDVDDLMIDADDLVDITMAVGIIGVKFSLKNCRWII